ncbi:MAG TPA: hypothetical protein VLP43_11255 [Solirubrobacteraceae bacterium]|nr:hypothetical protein [Solirubrobacteraceae bacterium]
MLGEGAHLVGHSYGGVIALLAAGLRPGALRSLVVSEPGLLRLAASEEFVGQMIARGEQLYRDGESTDPAVFLRMFRAGVHSSHETPDVLPPELDHGARLASRERPPWEAKPPIDGLARASFPKLVISGGHFGGVRRGLRHPRQPDRRRAGGDQRPRPHYPQHRRPI